MNQALPIDDRDACAGLIGRQTVPLHFIAKIVRDADCRRTGAEEDDLVFPDALARDLRSAQDCAQGDRGGSLNIVVESQQVGAITVENGARLRRGEVFPLKQRAWQLLLHTADKLIDKIEVLLAGHTLMTPAEIGRIFETLPIVGAHVEDNRQGAPRGYAADQ